MKFIVEGKEVIIEDDLIKEVSQDMGELIPVDLRRCNDKKLCPSCMLKGRTRPCNQPYWNKYIRGEPSLIEVILRSGEVFYAESWERE